MFAPDGGYCVYYPSTIFPSRAVLKIYQLFHERALAIIISYLSSASGITVLLKTLSKYRKLDHNKNKRAQKITYTLAIFVDHSILTHIS